MEKPLPTTMNAMAIISGALVATTLPLPTPASGEVLIQVAYAGVNRADIMQINGQYDAPLGASPLPGLEVSGWVAALGADAQGFALGDAVCALLNGGGYAQYVAVPQGQVLHVPKGMSLKTAASLPEAAATSMMALLHAGSLKAGERVLMHGGASGVGVLMAQIAKQLGAEVFATVGSTAKADFIQQHGITAINHRTAAFAEQVMALTHNQGVDVIIDTLGGPQLGNHLRLLRPHGRLVSLAMLEGSEIPPHTKMTRLMMNNLTWRGATLRNQTADAKAALMALVRAQLWPALENGAIKAQIDSCFALNDAKKALNRMQERLHMGKILLEVSPE